MTPPVTSSMPTSVILRAGFTTHGRRQASPLLSPEASTPHELGVLAAFACFEIGLSMLIHTDWELRIPQVLGLPRVHHHT